VRLWKERIGAVPLVGIGGITPERADDVISAGADSVAVITDYLTHLAPEERVRSWLLWSKANDAVSLTLASCSHRL
jgi:thiamine-phosphate pyrophosphorylase